MLRIVAAVPVGQVDQLGVVPQGGNGVGRTGRTYFADAERQK